MGRSGRDGTGPGDTGGDEAGADLALIVEAARAGAAAGLAKHGQLHGAVAALIDAGRLRPGDRVPPEQALARALGISLGTVQKALGRLAADGWIRREHGRGSFVAERRAALTDLWHYRFRDPATGELLAVRSRLVERRHTAGQGAWSVALGADPRGYVTLIRLVDIGGRFRCHSRMELPATRFEALLALPEASFEDVNLKQLFAERFDAPTLAVEQTVRPVVLPVAIARRLAARDRHGLQLDAMARTRGGRPLSFQRILIPPVDFPLDVSPAPPGPAAANPMRRDDAA